MGLVASAEQSRAAREPWTKCVIGAISALSEERDEIDACRTQDTLRAMGTGVLVSAAVAEMRKWVKEEADSSGLRDGAGAMVRLVYPFPRPYACLALQGDHPSVNLRTGMGPHRAVHQLSAVQANDRGKTLMKDKWDDVNKGFPEISGSLRKIEKDVMTITNVHRSPDRRRCDYCFSLAF